MLACIPLTTQQNQHGEEVLKELVRNYVTGVWLAILTWCTLVIFGMTGASLKSWIKPIFSFPRSISLLMSFRTLRHLAYSAHLSQLCLQNKHYVCGSILCPTRNASPIPRFRQLGPCHEMLRNSSRLFPHCDCFAVQWETRCGNNFWIASSDRLTRTKSLSRCLAADCQCRRLQFPWSGWCCQKQLYTSEFNQSARWLLWRGSPVLFPVGTLNIILCSASITFREINLNKSMRSIVCVHGI